MAPSTALYYIKQAVQGIEEDRIYQQWLAYLPLMVQAKKFQSFQEFRDSVTGANIDRRSTEEIVAEAKEIEERLKNGS